jgi:hypothetical protein
MWRTWLVVVGLSFLAAAVGCSDSPPSATGPVPRTTRKTGDKTTQAVLELRQALAAGAVPAVLSAATATPTAATDAYPVSMGELAVLSVEQKLKLYQAEHASVPETYEEFMDKIIEPGKPTGLRLPILPDYQEYAYDPATKTLLVVEFPAKKQQREKETTGAAGP